MTTIVPIQSCSTTSGNKNTQDTEYVSVGSALSSLKDKHNYIIVNLPQLDMSRKVHIPNPDNVDEVISAILNKTTYSYKISKSNGQNIITVVNVEEEEKNNNIDKDIIVDPIDRNTVARKQTVPKSYGVQAATYTVIVQSQKYNDTSDSDPPLFSNANTAVSESNIINSTSGSQPEKENTIPDYTNHLNSEKQHSTDQQQNTSSEYIKQHSIYTDEIDYHVKVKPNKWSAKTNLLYDATSTINIGVEYLISDKYSIDIPLNWNPWTFSNNNRFKHVLIQPELRYWKNSPLSGHFFGIHLHWAFYNIGKNSFPFHLNDRYQGWLLGAGLSYGYRWKLSNKIDFEATVGAGYAYLRHSKYAPEVCGPLIKQDQKHYWGITKTAFNIIYKF